MPRIIIKLREVMEIYKNRTGEKMTYKILSDKTGIAEGTLHNIGSVRNQGATLKTLAKICDALDVTAGQLLEFKRDEPGKMKVAGRKKR